MRLISDLCLASVWVNPTHLSETAMHVMRGHGLRYVGVLDGGELRGVVSLEGCRMASKESKVRDLMRPVERVVSPEMGVREVADLFSTLGLECAPVMDAAGYQGVLTATMLLRELGRSWDPLTGLPWSDELREWGMAVLKSGHEITLIFMDVNNFGDYNKLHGHIVGDRVLRGIAEVLQETSAKDKDVVVRYGGDEFAIGTLRHRSETEELALEVSRRVSEMPVEGIGEGVTVSYGVSGGKRTKERDNTHYAATLDNLINLASKECTSRKRQMEVRRQLGQAVRNLEASPAPAAPVRDSEVVLVSVDESDPSSPTVVSVNLDGKGATGVDVRGSGGALESVARATAGALGRLVPGLSLEVRDVVATPGSGNTGLLAVVANCSQDGRQASSTATVTLKDDAFKAVAEAMLEAYHRFSVQ